MILDFKDNSFFAFCSFIERDIPRNAGFHWDSDLKLWYTKSVQVAARLREYATPKAKEYLKSFVISVSPWTSPLPETASQLFPHQIQAVHFALERSSSYLALDPGLGKTAIAATVANALHQAGDYFGALYITPPFLVKNVQNEFKRWAPNLKTDVLHSKNYTKDFSSVNVLILSDSLLLSEWVYGAVCWFTDLLYFKLLIVDEAHRFKNQTAQRTKALIGSNGIYKLFDKKICMSGTPMPNRPIELFSVLNAMAPEVIGFKSWLEFGRYYCAGVYTNLGWDFSGVSNIGELNKNMVHPSGKYMLRMSKDLLDLPPKIEQVFLLSADMPPKLLPLESKTADYFSGGEDIKEKIINLNGLDNNALNQISTYRRVLGEYKAKDSLPFIHSLLDETSENILVFAFHKNVIETLFKGLEKWNPLVITGEISANKRQAIVDEYQQNKNRRLLIGNYQAMGVGFAIQKADRVLFIEFSWTPAENAQASDRPHRIGRKKPVLVQYLTYDNSLDEAVIRVNLSKIRTIKSGIGG